MPLSWQNATLEARMRVDLSGRTAVVTGSAGGIGQEICRALAESGARVVGFDVADQSATAAACEGKFQALRVDVTDPASVQEAAGRIEGDQASSVVIHAAGKFPNRPFPEWTFAQFEDLWRLNVGGVFNVTQALLPGMRELGWGRIITISTQAIFLAIPGFVPYVSTKSALIGFTRSLAAEVGAEGITVNAITPGLLATDAALTGDVAPSFDSVVAGQIIQRRGQASDLTSTVLYLCDGDSGFITGQTINVDGGAVVH
ncbi:SDR family oxidoreductase [Pseudonocardiaceae bacterium YIM PH 21723]|nr:SDR family oxidoreductase [Pseudonocardiaceae bacterium YIM PH 21723]